MGHDSASFAKPGYIMNKHCRPPVWAQKLLHWYCPVSILEEIEGDLLERFHWRVEQEGLASARRNYGREVLRFCNPVTFRKARAYSFTFYSPAHRLAMLRNYFISAFRNLSKRQQPTIPPTHYGMNSYLSDT